MSSDTFQTKWRELESNIPLFFNKLSVDDATAIAGDEDKLMGILYARYGYSDEQAQDAWDRFVRRYAASK